MSLGYLALEIKRLSRSARFVIFTVAFPVVMFLFFAGLYGDQPVPGTHIPSKVLTMISMTSWGAFTAAMNAGARVALERGAGWQRQLRLTPLRGTGYLAAKAIVGMVVALPSIVLVPLVGILAEGIRLDAGQWVQATVGVWLATLPFAVLGLLLGQVGTADSMQAIGTVVMLVLAMVGGLWFPLEIMPHWMSLVARAMPTYWMNQLGRGAVLAQEPVATSALVLAAWALALGVLVALRYRRDSARA